MNILGISPGDFFLTFVKHIHFFRRPGSCGIFPEFFFLLRTGSLATEPSSDLASFFSTVFSGPNLEQKAMVVFCVISFSATPQKVVSYVNTRSDMFCDILERLSLISGIGHSIIDGLCWISHI